MSETPENRKKRITANRQRALDYFGGKCKHCGGTDNLEFDHIDPSSVKFRICGKFAYSWEYILRELEKCQLLCRSCHWVKTRKERNLNQRIHGTVNMYTNNKCRCDLCKEAWRKYFVPKLKTIRNKKLLV